MSENRGNKTRLHRRRVLYRTGLVPVMSNAVNMTRVEKCFSQLVRADKLSRLDSRSY